MANTYSEQANQNYMQNINQLFISSSKYTTKSGSRMCGKFKLHKEIERTITTENINNNILHKKYGYLLLGQYRPWRIRFGWY